MEDRDLREILALLRDYGATLDEARFEAQAALWTDDAVLHVFGRDHVGREAILAFLKQAVTGKHFTGVPDVSIAGDRARVVSDFVFYRGGDRAFLSAGVYRDQLRRTAAGWRIERREIEVQLRREG